jgi:hypothetical protein
MKMHVITNASGEVIATAPAAKMGDFTVRIEPVDPKHKLYESVDVPDHLHDLKDVNEFHVAVRKHLPQHKG